jgi:pyruvate formate lyase activating enzyme
MLNYHSIETFGAHEGPGIRLVIFLQGCSFKCLYCHNPDTIECKKNKEISRDEIIKKLENGRAYYFPKGGITFSGGEPTLQSSEILSVFKKAKELGFNTCLDTNGSILNESTKKLLEYTDLVLLDVKHIDNKKHKILTGVSNKQTLKTAEYLEKNNIKMWLRYVLVPEFSDDISDIKKWCEYFINYKNIEKVEILPYHTLGEHKYEELGWEYKLKNIKPPTPEKILEVEKIFKKYFKKVVIR